MSFAAEAMVSMIAADSAKSLMHWQFFTTVSPGSAGQAPFMHCR
jgi:hypothetical protein